MDITFNISVETEENDKYFRELSVNKFPLIVTNAEDIEEFLKCDDLKSIIDKYIKTHNMFLTAFLNFRIISDDGEVIERVVKLRDIMPCPDKIKDI